MLIPKSTLDSPDNLPDAPQDGEKQGGDDE